jgi:hypothetical protein
MAQLTEIEKTEITKLVSEFNNLKMQLGDSYINQQIIMRRIDEIKLSYADLEKSLMETYGKDALINIETGDVTLPEKEVKKKNNKS